MANQHSSDPWPEPGTMIPDLLRAAPGVRPVLDKHGLRGCGGTWGPHESLQRFAIAHDVPLEPFLEELRQAVYSDSSTVEASPEHLADRIYRPFFRSGIAVTLTLGAAWGAILLLRIALSRSFAAATLHEVNAHGHAQIFGWVGLFVMGFAYQAFPRFKHTDLSHPRLAYATCWLMLAGIVGRSVLEPLAAWQPWAGPGAVAAAVVEILAIAIFVGIMLRTLASSSRRFEPSDYYVVAALGWFLVQGVWEAVYLAATFQAVDREHLLALVATWQGPMREIQIHGFAMLMILGVSQRFFHPFYGLPAPSPRKSVAAVVALNAAVAGEVVGFVLMRTASHAWAALWYGSILVLAAAVAMLVADWRLFSRPEESDRSLKFLRAAYVWLLISLAMLVLLPAYQFGLVAWLAPQSGAAQIGFSHAYYGAIRHAITVGFISLMIVGVAGKVVPTLHGLDLRRLGGLWLPFALINGGCAIRVFFQTLSDFTPTAFPVAGVSGLLELTGLAIWGFHLWRIMAGREVGHVSNVPPYVGWDSVPTEAGSGRSPNLRNRGTLETCPTAIAAQSIVAEALDAHPELLDVFVAHGFKTLLNPLLRRTIARHVTIAQACRRMGVAMEPLLAELNARCTPHAPREAVASRGA